MDIKELLESIPNILKYGIPGLTVILLFFSFLLLKKESEKSKGTITRSIKFFLKITVLLIIIFLGFDLLKTKMQDKPVGENWEIEGDIELRNDQNQTLHNITKNKCGEPLGTTINLKKFLKDNLKIIIFPDLPYKSFSSKSFSAKIPKNFGTEIKKVFFEIDGFHCITDNCRVELNTSNYKPKREKMIFMQDQPDTSECSSLGTP